MGSFNVSFLLSTSSVYLEWCERVPKANLRPQSVDEPFIRNIGPGSMPVLEGR